VFCARCGQQIPEASEVCPLCGQQTTLKLDPIPAMAPALAQPRSPYAFVTIPQNLGPSGIGGWLLLYCLGLSILTPLIGMAELSVLLRFLNYEYVVDFIRALYGTVVGIVLLTKRPIAIFLLRIYFIVTAASLLLTLLRLIAVALRPHSPLVLVREITALIVQIIIPALWFAYFHKSERVRNTYGANL
jgi:hypothetical protein